jgi:3-hydroxy-3-methylglutaryl CoA synthase
MILFYTAVQNVFVTIIMEGYEESIKEREQKKLIDKREAQDRENFERNLEEVEQMEEMPSP